MHALFGGATSSLGGSNFSEGAYVGGLTEAMMPELEKMAGTITGPDGKKYVNPERLQQIAYIFGYAVNKSLGQSGQSGAYVARMGAKYNQEGDWTASYMPPIATDRVVGGESIATQAYNVSMRALGNPTEVTSKDINRAINVIGGLAGDTIFTAINMNQNRIEFEGRPDLIEKADELDKISLGIGTTGSVATLGVGAVNSPGGTVVGGVFAAANTGYGIYAEYEKDKLREEYKQWKAKGAK